jgi:hypothetical protein
MWAQTSFSGKAQCSPPEPSLRMKKAAYNNQAGEVNQRNLGAGCLNQIT